MTYFPPLHSDLRYLQSVRCRPCHHYSRTRGSIRRIRLLSAYRFTPQWDPSFLNTLRRIMCPETCLRDLKHRWITPVSERSIDPLITELTIIQTQAMFSSSVSRRPRASTHKIQPLPLPRIQPTLRVGIPLLHHIPLVDRGSQLENALFMPTLTFLGADQSTLLPCFLLRSQRQYQAENAKFTLSLWRKPTLSLFIGCSNGYMRTGFCSRKKMTQDRPWRALAQDGACVA